MVIPTMGIHLFILVGAVHGIMALAMAMVMVILIMVMVMVMAMDMVIHIMATTISITEIFTTEETYRTVQVEEVLFMQIISVALQIDVMGL